MSNQAYNTTNKEVNNTGLIGHPLGHSISPVIHEYLGQQLSLNVKYDKYDIAKESLGDKIDEFLDKGLKGLNVTIPYKVDVMDYLSNVSESAQSIGAVNTIVNNGGHFDGYNTDYLGLKRELMHYNIDLKDKSVVILGNGGASKAVRYLCTIMGASKISQFNRTPDGDLVRPYSEVYLLPSEDKEIVFQTTSVGMYPNCNDAVIMKDSFYEGIRYGIDVIYNPYETLFMKKLKEHGACAYNGLRMLLYQAIEAFKLFHGIKDIDALAEEKCYLNMLLNMNDSIVMCGMMGSGKSTLGREIAEINNAIYIDTDAYIEKNLNMSINDIFEQKGEEAFRKEETKCLNELFLKYRNNGGQKIVYSLGGGMCTKENIPLIKRLGCVVYIDSPAETLISRLKGDTTRPMLKDGELENNVRNLLDKRIPLYLEAADEIINN